MADLSVPDVFPPEDPVAMFCLSMAMAANDVEYAVRQAVLANPEGATDEDLVRLRFNQKIRLVYGFLFEGIHALKSWRELEADVSKLLGQLPKPGARLLKQVCGLEQRLGTETIAHVRHNTFHYPHPDRSKTSAWIEELSNTVADLDDESATIPMDQETEHTFPFADKIAVRMALRKHDTDAQTAEVRDGAVAFVNLVRHIHIRYCEQRGIVFELVGNGSEDFQILRHRHAEPT